MRATQVTLFLALATLCAAAPGAAQVLPWNSPLPSPMMEVGRLSPEIALAPAAVPDTTAPWRYFPLQVGNAWEYEDISLGIPPRLVRYEVLGEVATSGRKYFRYVRKDYLVDGTQLGSFTEWAASPGLTASPLLCSTGTPRS